MSQTKNQIDTTYHISGSYVRLEETEEDSGMTYSRIIQRCSVCGLKLVDHILINENADDKFTYNVNTVIKVVSMDEGDTVVRACPELDEYPHPQCIRFIE